MRLPWIDEEALARAHPKIFHYTKRDVLPRILSSGGLFSTNYLQTNDSMELRSLLTPIAEKMAAHALPIARERLSRGDLHHTIPEDQFENILHGDTRSFFDIVMRTMPNPPHLTCFSAHDAPHHRENGVLTMWRIYGGDDQGVALGFNTKKLVEMTNTIQEKFAIDTIYLDRVGYGDHDPQTAARMDDSPEVPGIFAPILIALFEGRLDEVPEQDPVALSKFVVLNASAKHPDFEDEREVRLVCRSSPDEAVNGRIVVPSDNNRMLIGYLDALEEVLIGPSRDQDGYAEALKIILNETGFGHVAIRRSQTPYRQV